MYKVLTGSPNEDQQKVAFSANSHSETLEYTLLAFSKGQTKS
jgi:hypothetical protein